MRSWQTGLNRTKIGLKSCYGHYTREDFEV